MGRAYVPRANLGGNFCGHDPRNPRFTLTRPAKTGKGGIPRVLTLCAERLQDYYHRPRQVIPSLDLVNGSARQQRSERREACVLLLTALLKYTDLASLRVGIPTPDGFLNLTVDYIAQQTGMTLRRAERALADLRTSGLVTIAQARKPLPDGSWKGLAAIKAISRHLFTIFSLGRILKKERTKASKRLKQKARQWAMKADKATHAGLAQVALTLKALRGNPGRKPEPRHKPPDDLEDRRRLNLKLAELKAQHWDWDRTRLIEEAERILFGRAPHRA